MTAPQPTSRELALILAKIERRKALLSRADRVIALSREQLRGAAPAPRGAA